MVLQDQMEGMVDDIDRLREALEIYAKPENWDGDRFKRRGPVKAMRALGLPVPAELGDEE